MREMAATCAGCGTLLAPHRLLYDERGQITCETCASAHEVAASHRRSARQATALAFGNPEVGLVRLVFNPFFLMTAIAIGNGLYLFRRMRADRQHKEAGPADGAPLVAAVFGIALGALGALINLLR